MNNPAIKRLAKELQEIQQFNQIENDNDNDDNCIEAAPLKVTNWRWKGQCQIVFVGRFIWMAFHIKRSTEFSLLGRIVPRKDPLPIQLSLQSTVNFFLDTEWTLGNWKEDLFVRDGISSWNVATRMGK